MKPRAIAVVAILALAMTGCSDDAKRDADERSAVSQLEQRTAVAELVRDYQQARAAGQWDLALSYADQLQKLAPDSGLDGTVQSTLADTSMRAHEARDKSHLATLWSYNVVAMNGRSNEIAMITASIQSDRSSRDPDAEPARLVIRSHPKWGHSVGLVLDNDKFECAHTCSVSVWFDDQPARPFAASIFGSNPHSLNIDDEQAIRASLDTIRVLTIDVVVDGKPRSLRFSVGGFDRVALERKLQ